MNRLVEVIRVALDALWAHKLRSSLTLLGVIIGVATIITVVSAISGLNAYVSEQIFTLSPDVFIVSKFGIILNRDDFFKAMRRKNLTFEEMQRITEMCTTCRGVGASAGGTKVMRHAAFRLADVRVTGSTANLAELYNVDVVAGRFYTEAEVRRAAPVAVIGWDVQDQLFPDVDPLGKTVTVDGYPLKVIGLLRKQGSVLGQSQDNIAYLPLSLYGKVFGRNRSLDIWVRAASLERFGETQDEVRVLLRRLRATPFRDEDPFGMVNAEALQGLWRGISAGAFAMMILIAGISLVVGGIVIMNIMLVSVVERTREIGVRTSLGARRRDIRQQFLLEASILSAIGGVIGVVLGVGVARSITAFTPFPTRVQPELVLIALLLATGVGLIFGLWPAVKASRLDPIEALRSE